MSLIFIHQIRWLKCKLRLSQIDVPSRCDKGGDANHFVPPPLSYDYFSGFFFQFSILRNANSSAISLKMSRNLFSNGKLSNYLTKCVICFRLEEVTHCGDFLHLEKNVYSYNASFVVYKGTCMLQIGPNVEAFPNPFRSEWSLYQSYILRLTKNSVVIYGCHLFSVGGSRALW